MSFKKFDEDRLQAEIPFDSLLKALGVEHTKRDFLCPYLHDHNNVRMTYYLSTNLCHCHNCKETAGIVKITMKLKGWDFKEACAYLHEAFNIPYLEGDLTGEVRTLPKNSSQPKIEYVTFDENHEYKTITLAEHISKYHSLNETQRLKMVYTFFYRHSLNTEQKAKFAFYKKERGIPSNNTYIQKIGYLSQDDSKEVLGLMLKYFGEKDLLEFGILKDRNGKVGYAFESIPKGGLLLVPSFDLYTDMVTGFMIRPTHPPQWMRDRKTKELQLSKTHIIKPLPFGLTYQALKENDTFYQTEGHPDLASLPGNINGVVDRAGFASPGTHGFKDEMMSLLRGKKVVLVYDQDFSGQKAEYGYHALSFMSGGEEKKLEFLDTKEGKQKLKEELARLTKYSIEYKKKFHMGMRQKLISAGVKNVETLKWNRQWGGDINDLRINGNLSLVFTEE